LDWDATFEPGCDDAVFSVTDGVPRLINQLCDHALVASTEAGHERVTPARIAAAWSEIQRLPPPAALAAGGMERATGASEAAAAPDGIETAEELGSAFALEAAEAFGSDMGVVEFGSFGDDAALETDAVGSAAGRRVGDFDDGGPSVREAAASTGDPWHGPEVELVFDAAMDPFEEYFEQEERVMERYVMRGPEDFSGHGHVASREGAAIARQLDACDRGGQVSAGHAPMPFASAPPTAPTQVEEAPAVAVVADPADIDDSDMVVIEEDILEHPSELRGKSIFAVRPGDYRSLFARLRRGDR
ncbi:MAG: hypothetical protein ACKOBP_14020, partial [Planctomycetia bacterium]